MNLFGGHQNFFLFFHIFSFLIFLSFFHTQKNEKRKISMVFMEDFLRISRQIELLGQTTSILLQKDGREEIYENNEKGRQWRKVQFNNEKAYKDSF